MSDHAAELASFRETLDLLDEKLVALIDQRAEIALQVGASKAASGMKVYAPDRERQVLDRVCSLSKGPIDARALRSVYRELMSASLALERTPRIAILGPAGSFSHLAGRRRFGASVEFEVLTSISDVFDAVQRGHAEFALVPVENSIAGGVGETLDALITRDVVVCGEIHLAVHHHLLGLGPIDELEHVYSKPEVFAQCQQYLSANGLADKVFNAASTSDAARLAKERPNTAAIAGNLAAELFDLPKLATYIEDDSGNVTRFLILGSKGCKPVGSDKTSIVFSVGHEPGKLVEALDAFRQRGVNMTRIESRPDRLKRWGYYFFVDVEGHVDDPAFAESLAVTANRCSFWKVLGSYPKADEVL